MQSWFQFSSLFYTTSWNGKFCAQQQEITAVLLHVKIYRT
jgi:hypothetical protein